MPTFNTPQDVQSFKQYALSQGESPADVQAFIDQNSPQPASTTSSTATPQGQSLPAEPPSLGGFGKNIISSGVDVVKGTGSSLINVLNPNMEKNTVANLGRLSAGAAQLLDPTSDNRLVNSVPILGDLSKMAGNQEDTARAVGSYYSDRYGVGDALKGDFGGAAGKIGNTLYNDPVGAALDASMVLDLGGSALGKLGDASKIEKLSQAGKLAKEAGSFVDPLKAVGRAVSPKLAGVGEKAGGAIEEAGKGMALKALKPSATQIERFEKATGVPLTSFIEENNLFGAGKTAVTKADDLINPLQEQYNSLVRTGKEISGADYATQLRNRAVQILDKDRSPAARATAEGLWKEASTQEQLGNITDTVLTNSKGSSFSKVPGNAMVDATALNVNKEMGGVALGMLDEVAPGSAEIGKKLQALREFKAIAEKQAGLGKGSNIIGLMKPSGSAGLIGGAVGTMVGNPIAGAAIGAGVGLASQNPAVLEAAGNVAQKVGRGLGSTPNLNGALGAVESAGRNMSRLVPNGTQELVPENQGSANQNGQFQNGPNEYQENGENVSNALHSGLPLNPADAKLGQTGSTDSISQHSGVVSSDKLDTLNEFGATPKQIYTAYVKAATSGNKKKAAVLKGMYDDEVAFQKTQGNGKSSLTSGQATELSDLSNSSLMLDELSGSIEAYSDKMGPIQGRASEMNPYDTTAQVFNGQMNIAAQVIGKALEGGKLAEQDIGRYRKMLPNITDLPATAKKKLENVQRTLNLFSKNKEQFYTSNTITPDISPFLQSDENQGGGGGTLPLRPPVLQNY